MGHHPNPVSGRSSAELQWICRSTLEAAFPFFRNLQIWASFYPYVGLSHTIRRGKDGWVLRISDHCSNAPRIVLEAIILILACKVMKRKPPAGMVRVYDLFRKDPDTEAAVDERRLRKGRKVIRESRGKHHSLREIYLELNEQYFNGQVEIRQLGWGPRRSWGRLGHYDPVHHTITISPVLDSPRLPRNVLAYIVFHEMLHTLFDSPSIAGRKRHHPQEFRKAERAYPDFRTVKRLLAHFCQTRGR